MAIIGNIYHDTAFVFSDNTIGDKLFITLNDTPPYLVLKTTSQNKHYSGIRPLCNPSRFVFYIPQSMHAGFIDDTYIQLNEIFEYSHADFISKSFKKTLNKIGTLPVDKFNALLNCLKLLQNDISPTHFTMLFNKKHPQIK
jgi:hypothetical protein